MPDFMSSSRYKDYIKPRKKSKGERGAGADRSGGGSTGVGTKAKGTATVQSPFQDRWAGKGGGSVFGSPSTGGAGAAGPAATMAGAFAAAPPRPAPPVVGAPTTGWGGMMAAAERATGGGQTDAVDGFASRYAPGSDFMSMLYSNPEVLVQDSLKGMGIGNGGGLVDLMSENADMYNFVNMLMNGDQGRQSMQDGDSINYVNSLITNSATPGGRLPNQEVMLKNLLDAPKGSAMESLMAGTPEQQVQTVSALAQAAYGGSNPLMQRAVANELQQQGRDYIANSARGEGGVGGGNRSFANWLQVNGGQLF
ncbi:hypothetical protein [Iamia sp.]|uniref:hypothetical protein n=1 Tax=Iamia sp. TaxID=2722710 RepID=UPI002C82A754|nr:hypothetical protein [Iamia sp.]HXH56609.1 hypothetical protein [Iamia sp.]